MMYTFHPKIDVFSCFREFHRGYLEFHKKTYDLWQSAYIISLFVCYRDYSLIMPARKVPITPVKGDDVCEDVLGSHWCVTNRRGFYVFNNTLDPNEPNYHKGGELIKLGVVTDVSYSAVYSVEGTKTPVYKFKVYIEEYEHEEEQWKWYVVKETDFQNFADSNFRHEHLRDPLETSCMNVDKQLLEDWSTGIGCSKGNWFKRWFFRQMGLLEPSARQKAQARQEAQQVIPPVFGAQPGVLPTAATTTTTPHIPIVMPPAPSFLAQLPSVQRMPQYTRKCLYFSECRT